MMDFIKALEKSTNSKHTKESRRRAEICAKCPLKEKRFYADFFKAEIIEVEGFVCLGGQCLHPCPIATKVFATESKNMCKKW
jgi:hypothetical protein